jgi:hypothetical protein
LFFAQQHLAKLRNGRTLQVDYLLPELHRVLEMRLKGASYGTGGSTRVEVIAASPFLRPFVPTTIFEFDAAAQFVALTGRLTPQLGTVRQPVAIDGKLTLGAPLCKLSSSCNNKELTSRLTPASC